MEAKDLLKDPFMLGFANAIEVAWQYLKKCEGDTTTNNDEMAAIRMVLSEMKLAFLEKVRIGEEYGFAQSDSETTTNGPE